MDMDCKQDLIQIWGGCYSVYLSCLNSIVIIGVNIFFLISGYFSIKFSVKKIVSLIVNIYVYTILLSIASVLLKIEAVNMELIKFIIFPFFKYWFIFVYIVLVMVSPIINEGVEKIEKKNAIGLTLAFSLLVCGLGYVNNIAMLGINNGYSVMFAMYLYWIGRMMYKYNFFKTKIGLEIIIWIVSTIMTMSYAIIGIILEKYRLAWHVFSYNQIFIVMASVSFFWIFIMSKECMKLKKIAKTAKHILPVYYIHTSAVFSYYRNMPLIYLRKNANYLMQFVFLLFFTIIILAVCIIIDLIKNKVTVKIKEVIS